MLSPYNEQVEEQMRTVYDRLSEKDRRLYAAVEALKLPYGGTSYIARVFGCSRDTIRRGIQELGIEEVLAAGQDRKAGAGTTKIAVILWDKGSRTLRNYKTR